MEQRLTEKNLRELSGMLVLMLKASEMIGKKLELELFKEHSRVQRDVKKMMGDALALSVKLNKKFEKLDEIAIRGGEARGGQTDKMVVFDAMMQDAGDLVHLVMEYENAREDDELALLKLVSYAKTLNKGEQVFSSELIADIVPRV